MLHQKMQTAKFFVTLLLSMVCLSVAYILANRDFVPAKNKSVCEQKNQTTNQKAGEACFIWDANMCRKGVFTDNIFECKTKDDVLPTALFIIGVILILYTLYFLFSMKRKPTQKQI